MRLRQQPNGLSLLKRAITSFVINTKTTKNHHSKIIQFSPPIITTKKKQPASLSIPNQTQKDQNTKG